MNAQAFAESVERVAGSTKATQVAWVAGSKPDAYRLCINTKRGDTLAFWPLHMTEFDDFRAAQCIANAIRRHVAGVK